MRIAIKTLSVSLVLVLGLAGCSSTRTTAEWRDPAVDKRYAKVLVIGIWKDAVARRSFEDKLVGELQKRGVAAESSTRIMPVEEKVSPETVKAAIEGKGFDGVLVTHLVGVREEEVRQPATYRPVATPRYRRIYPYYSHVYDYVYEPGYYERFQVMRLETNLYDTGTENIVWSMQSDTVEPNATQKAIDSVIELTIETLESQKLI